MFDIKKIFFLFNLLTAIAVSFSAFNTLADEGTLASRERLIKQVEHLLKQSSESLNYDEVMNLSNKIIHHRSKYPNEIVAKTYLLLTNIALNKGEVETAFQFTLDGLALTSPNQQAYPYLQVKLAEVLMAKKQYKKLLMVAEQAIQAPTINQDAKYLMLAFGYRSVAYAKLFHHDKALKDLQKVHSIIDDNPAFNEHISLLSILAKTYYHLGEFQTALTIQLKILKLRFNLNQLVNVGQTYYQLGNAYFNLRRYNDAYNAYWEAKQYAVKNETPIYAAYAGQGLALTLQQQGYYQQAKIELLSAQTVFYQHHLTTSYLEALITLAQLSHATQQTSASIEYLLAAEKIAKNVILNENFIIFYQLVAQMYRDKNQLEQAYLWQEKYSQALQQNMPAKSTANVNNTQNRSLIDSVQTRQLTLELAQLSELTSTFTNKYQQQQIIIVILAVIIAAIIFIHLIIYLIRRESRTRKAYDAQENPNDTLANPVQTKQLYQTTFNMAKKHSYTLALGYISISNWQELEFKFNKKIIKEVTDGIANLINEHLNEFEHGGLINHGEYLLLFPHQSKEDVSLKMEKILQALHLRFFANLGEFSVTLAYSVESPDFQDIDPFIFLSHLSSAAKSI